MFWNSFWRALADTFGHLQSWLSAAVGGAGALVALYFWMGLEMALGEVPYVVTGIIGAFGSVTLLFAWNLVTAPYRIVRERAAAAEKELQTLRPKPLPELPQAEADAIAACAIKAGERLHELYPPLEKRAWAIHDIWENKKLNHETKTSFETELAQLSEEVHVAHMTIKQLKGSDRRYQERGFEFVFETPAYLGDFKQAVDMYHNAVRELSEGQDTEILRLYSQNLIERSDKYRSVTMNAERILGIISHEPSKLYVVDTRRL